MTDRQRTHGHDCWGWGPKHYECAVREIERLAARLTAPQNAPVGVDFAAVASILRRAMRDGVHYGYRRDFILQQALALEALSQQPAAADGTDAQAAEIEALRAEVERLRADRDSWEQQASDRVADWYAEHLRAERLAEALRESHGEVLRLRAAMFRVCATAANGGNPTMYIEQMRDEMNKPWSGDKSSAALEQEAGRG